MKGKSISIWIINILFVVVFVVPCLIACSISGDEAIRREFLYNRYRDGVVSKQERALYTWRGDTITQELTILDSVKNVLSRERKVFVTTGRGLDALVNGVLSSFLTFDSTKCWQTTHAMGFVVERCFKARWNYKGYPNAIEFTERNLMIDGGTETIYLDKNFAVIDRVRIGSGSYDSVVRIKETFPQLHD